MSYFIHNKYDRNSSDQVTNVSGTDYTFNSDNTVTVIDYFGLLEKGDETYKYLDTTYMGIQPITELAYTTIDTENLIGNTPTTDGKSNTEYASGISKILDKLQITVGEKTDTGGSESDGTVMAKLNGCLNKLSKIFDYCLYPYRRLYVSDDIIKSHEVPSTISTRYYRLYSFGTKYNEKPFSVSFNYPGQLIFEITVQNSSNINTEIDVIESDAPYTSYTSLNTSSTPMTDFAQVITAKESSVKIFTVDIKPDKFYSVVFGGSAGSASSSISTTVSKVDIKGRLDYIEFPVIEKSL